MAIDWLDASVGTGIGILLGGLAVAAFALWRQSRLRSEVSNAQARAALLASQLEARDAEEERLKAVFAALGTDALRANSEQFTQLASRALQTVLAEAKGDLEQRKQAIDQLVAPIRGLLEKHNAAVEDIERRRQVAYRGLEEQIRSIAASHEKLGTATGRLVAALRRPEQRGRWGEMQLRNTVELAGMTVHCDFVEQPQTDDPSTKDRPDMIVQLPGGGEIVVDSKVALDAYLDSLEEDSDRSAARRRHADQVAAHVRKLASKRYWEQFDRTPKLAVMFMPLESALAVALELEPDLLAQAMRQHVFIATPTLLVALLRAVAFGWQEEAIAANARRIADTGRELYDRLAIFVEHHEKVGRSLERAMEAYNDSVGSLERMVLPSTRRLKEMQATTKEDVDAPAPVEVETRPFTAAELKPQSQAPALETDDA